MIHIKSATAWKEYAHIPSISEKLEKAGFLKNRVKQTIAALKKKTNAVEQTYGGEKTEPMYVTSLGEGIRDKLGQKNILGHYIYRRDLFKKNNLEHNSGTIQNNVGAKIRGYIERTTNTKLNNRNKADIRVHELLEKMYSGDRNNNFTANTTHGSPSVLIQEARIYNQTGGDNFRRNKILPIMRREASKDVLAKYETDENALIQDNIKKYTDKTGRIRSRAYKLATKNINKQVLDWEPDTMKQIYQDGMANTYLERYRDIRKNKV